MRREQDGGEHLWFVLNKATGKTKPTTNKRRKNREGEIKRPTDRQAEI